MEHKSNQASVHVLRISTSKHMKSQWSRSFCNQEYTLCSTNTYTHAVLRTHMYTCACSPTPSHRHTHAARTSIHMCVYPPPHTHIPTHTHVRPPHTHVCTYRYTNSHARTHTHKIRVSVHGLPGADAEPAQWKIPPSRCLIKCCDNGTVCLFLQRSVGKITMHYNS